MKTIISVIAGALLFCVVIFGGEKTWSYFQGGKSVINNEVDKHSPMPLEFERLKSLISNMQEKTIDYEVKLTEFGARARSTGHKIAELKRNLDIEKQILSVVKSRLETKKNTYLINGCRYSYHEVAKDALARVSSCKKLEEQITFEHSLLNEYRNGEVTGRKNFKKAEKKLEELKTNYQKLKIENEIADTKLDIAKMTATISMDPFGTGSELEKTWSGIVKRIEEKKVRANRTLADHNSGVFIDYSEAVSMQDASSEIEQYLSGTSVANWSDNTSDSLDLGASSELDPTEFFSGEL
ncbi:PspA/IM30 family protein [bacterium]|nr:PspA/IM30 family protein [bacterium]